MQANPPFLRQLILDGIPLSNSTVNTLSVAIQKNFSLESLSLNQCAIGDESLLSITIGIQTNSSLRRLELRKNKITSNGLESIGDALEFNKTLGCILLNENEIEEFSNAEILRNEHLKRLGLSCNNLNAVNLIKLFDAVRANKTLNTLEIAGYILRDKVFASFCDMIANNRSLCELVADVDLEHIEAKEATTTTGKILLM